MASSEDERIQQMIDDVNSAINMHRADPVERKTMDEDALEFTRVVKNFSSNANGICCSVDIQHNAGVSLSPYSSLNGMLLISVSILLICCVIIALF